MTPYGLILFPPLKWEDSFLGGNHFYLTQHVNPLTKNFFKVVQDSSYEAEVFQKMHQDKSILAGMDA